METDLSLIPIHPTNQLFLVIGLSSHPFNKGVEVASVFWFDGIAGDVESSVVGGDGWWECGCGGCGGGTAVVVPVWLGCGLGCGDVAFISE